MKLWKIADLTDKESDALDKIIIRAGFYPVLELIVSSLMAEVEENMEIDDDERSRLGEVAQEINTTIEDA